MKRVLSFVTAVFFAVASLVLPVTASAQTTSGAEVTKAKDASTTKKTAKKSTKKSKKKTKASKKKAAPPTSSTN